MLPIKQVLLYKHGVGFFEREGSVENDASIELHFKTSEMNDVLKSLTVLDLSGGLISSISYESTKPVEKQLEDISIRLSDENALTDLISQVKGTLIRIDAGGEGHTGIVAGIEMVLKEAGESVISSPYLALLVNGESLLSFDFMEIGKITFLDESLKTDLAHLLEVLISAKKKDSKKLTIYAKGNGVRDILASYVVETPVWKASYRVLLSDNAPVIQGWALVDNTTDEDWKNISLTLVAGLPISFVHDLYSPRYKKRPVVVVKEEESYAPPILEEGIPCEPECAAGYPDEESDGFALMEARAPAPMQMGMAVDKMTRTRSLQQARAESMPVQTRTVEVGDLFQYEIKNPVTVKRNQSALVPILQTAFEGKKSAVYNPEVRDKNPMSALLLKNTTGLTLEGGTVTVLEDENYVGEAMLETLKPNEERLVPYSVELSCVITRDRRTENTNVHRARISSGYVYFDFYRLQKSIYKIHNKKNKPLDLFLEHRFNHGWELVDTPKPHETTENFYRFRIDVPAEKTIEFVVVEKYQQYNSYSLRNITGDLLSSWYNNGYFDKNTHQEMDKILELSIQISQINQKINHLENEMREIHGGQKRLRENLQALGTSSGEKKLRDRYIKQMEAEEDRLMELRNEIKNQNVSKQNIEKTLNDLINSLQLAKTINS